MNIGKKLLSLLTVFCLTLSLVPTVALASTSSPSSVKINNSVEMVGQETTYYTSGGNSSTVTEPNTWTAKYEPSIHKLTLKNYRGGSIFANGDLTISLDGTNSITSQDNGINLGYIPFNSVNASLTIEGNGSITLSSATNSTIYVTNNLTIQGGAKVTAADGRSGQAIHANGGTIIIQGSGTTVTAENAEVRSGNSNGRIDLKDGATLTARSVGGTVKINGTAVNSGLNFSNGVTAPSISTYTISGTVMDASRKPINGASVQLAPTGTDNVSTLSVINPSTVTTSEEGAFSFSVDSIGSYKITVSAQGYNNFTETFNVSGDITKNLTLTKTQTKVTYTVTVNATENMTVSESVSQTVDARQPIQDIFFTANEGYYFDTNYNVPEQNGIVVTRIDYTKIKVAGIPTQTTTITLPELTPKEKQNNTLNYSNFNAYDCTSAENKDGIIKIHSAVNGSKIEYYKKDDSDNIWIEVSGTGADRIISSLVPGTYLIRYAGTDTKKPSNATEVTICPFTEYGIWVCGIPVTNSNKNDILGDRKVSYADNTLTLNGATIKNTASPTVALGGSTKSYAERAGIFTTGNLTIHVTGDSSISSTYGSAIKGNGNLTISGTASLTLNSLDDMNSLSLDYNSSTLIIKDKVNITAIVDLSSPLGPGNVSAGISVSAYNTTIQDFANVTAINKGTGLALYSPNNITVKNSAILTAQSEQKGNATSAITYPGHTVTASTTFDGSSSGGSTEPYNPAKLSTYKYVKVEPTTGVVVTGVILSKDNLSMKIGQSETLTKNLLTTDNSAATVQDVTWISDNPSIATVDEDGKVTAISVGTATITVLTKDGGYTDTCTVTVSNPSSSGGSHTTYYPVNTPAKSEGGSVVVSPKSASKGSAVTVTVTPESGYQVSSVQAVDKDGKKLTLTDKGDGKYTFVMPGSKVEVSASFAQVQKPEEPSPYRDVSKDSYYYDAVQWASDKGITNGVSDGVFAPDWVCTRGQIVTFLWRSVGSPAPKTAEMPFADVAEDAYYAQAVLWAVENGITKGTSETTFSPDQTCTRAHAVAFLYRLAGSPAVTGNSFQDVAADAYYNAAVAWAVQQGITNGTSETTFSPDETCTRAQIVTFLYRMDQAK